eukprot:GHVO01036059.1.p1 GENE.GHVO01036059.1~~GHVO01036059.1.p1  ORF type:complete len:554 (-),score=23.27 GHVO01036059.1:71-1591(-)
MPDFASQEILDGRFCLLDLLGAGSYGKVYKARDNRPRTPQNPRYYAVKILRKADPSSREGDMQLRELRLQKKVSHHPNIVTFCGAFEEGDFFFVVLELCDGYDLFSAIVDEGLFDGNDQLIKSCFVKILDAVHFCHQQGVFHRDLKPENVLCSKDGVNIWLADFGLATNRRACADFGCGSRAYMSPECIGKETNNVVYSALHNDIWSLGVILVNLVTRHNPWSYAHSSDPCFDAFLLDSNSIRNALPISDALHSILKRILHLDPMARISIPFLRNEILAVKTFYAPSVSVVVSSPAIPNAQIAIAVEVVVAPREEFLAGEHISVRVDHDHDHNNLGSSSSASVNPAGLEAYIIQPHRPQLFLVGSLSSCISSSFNLSEEDDGDILITPPHGPIALICEVSELKIGEGMGDLVSKRPVSALPSPNLSTSLSAYSSESGSVSGRSLRRRPRFDVDPRIGFKKSQQPHAEDAGADCGMNVLKIVVPEPVYATPAKLRDGVMSVLTRSSV